MVVATGKCIEGAHGMGFVIARKEILEGSVVSETPKEMGTKQVAPAKAAVTA